MIADAVTITITSTKSMWAVEKALQPPAGEVSFDWELVPQNAINGSYLKLTVDRPNLFHAVVHLNNAGIKTDRDKDLADSLAESRAYTDWILRND